MELRQLRYFLSVADCRSFVSAANKLYITRQAVSKAVSQLESELNVELFMRDSNGAFLTPAGVKFYDRVRSLVMELDQIRSDMQTYGNRYRQRIRLAFTVGSMYPFEERLIDYRHKEENTEIEYAELPYSECMRRLQAHEADIVISPVPQDDPLYLSEPIYSSPLGILLRDTETLGEITTLTPRDLVWLPLAVHAEHGLIDFCKKNALTPQFQGYDFLRLFELAAKGQCALLIPQCFVPEERKDLRWIPVEKATDWMLYLIYTQSVERNALYSAAVDHLSQNVLQQSEEKPHIYPQMIL